ncbi:erythrocyte membrane-associated antigen, putative [Babesia ovis]|uniref:Erythrocyte membrane-associated antigen, putative n=1 Tax=Babesia ovis TaxID=5869 RepID=A0A9W5WW52_BABOV|nr:erythrocyte membrane-associated antigen, putative [Babesia ovis]
MGSIAKADVEDTDSNRQHKAPIYKGETIVLDYSTDVGYSFAVRVGNQDIYLRLVSDLEGIVLFSKGTQACQNSILDALCYDPKQSSTAVWCQNKEACVPGKDDYKCNEQKSHEEIDAATTTDFGSDGIRHHMETIEGYDKVAIRNVGLMVPPVFDRVPVKLATHLTVNAKLPIAKDIGGFFGLSGSSASCRGWSLWTEFLKKYDGIYLLDLYGEMQHKTDLETKETNAIKLGMEVVKRNEIIWAEKRQVGGIFTDASSEFTAYGMYMCGVNLFGKTSASWQVAVDLTSKCLVLPRNFWFSVMAQLPVVDGCYQMDPPKMCQLRLGRSKVLSEIEFRLHNESRDTVLKIPLENLLLDNSETPTICIIPDEDTASPPVFTDRPTIKFGYKVLESMQVVVDTNGRRVGFIPKKQVYTNNAICIPPVTCVGDQKFLPELNYCLQPSCNIWSFKTLDAATGRCVTSKNAVVMLCVILTVFLVAEIRRFFVRRSVLRKAKRLC